MFGGTETSRLNSLERMVACLQRDLSAKSRDVALQLEALKKAVSSLYTTQNIVSPYPLGTCDNQPSSNSQVVLDLQNKLLAEIKNRTEWERSAQFLQKEVARYQIAGLRYRKLKDFIMDGKELPKSHYIADSQTVDLFVDSLPPHF